MTIVLLYCIFFIDQQPNEKWSGGGDNIYQDMDTERSKCVWVKPGDSDYRTYTEREQKKKLQNSSMTEVFLNL